MIEDKYLKILKCPDTNEALFNSGNELITVNSGIKYSATDDIPVLIPASAQIHSESALYSEMDYINHYIKDAEEFSYFEAREDKATEHDERRQREYIMSLMPRRKGLYVLDAGSGGGWLANELKNSDTMLVSFDLSLRNIREITANTRIGNHIGVVGDALTPPFMAGSFDCIVASEIIEHLTDPALFINSMFRLLKPGGRLIVSTPHKEKIIYSLCIHCNKPTPRNAHLHSFSSDKLKKLCPQADTPIYKDYVFGNKALIFARTYVILRYLPFPVWKFADSISNLVLPKQAHIIAVYEKKRQ